ncbi:MAG: hypothetical protein BWY82_00773 [Verrucomicrobia bacterium ADurb.Bin474]|nr:MAG: hypothetical protein BWY82_00773 [Verrucomicrobia bacterium ADurb.Bin474]
MGLPVGFEHVVGIIGRNQRQIEFLRKLEQPRDDPALEG